MSRQLVESIVAGNMLEASDVVSAKLDEIRACKMYEMKKMYQAEAFGGLSKQEIEARKKAGYVKAADILGDPKEKRGETSGKRLNPRAKLIRKDVKEQSMDEDWTRALKLGAKRTATRLNVMRQVPGALKDIAIQGAKDAVSDPLSTVGKVAGAVGGGVARGTKKLAGDLADIGFKNLN